MVKNLRGKRPCCICRKWFLPDVRQKEQHRRQCQAWNKKNKAYFKNNYLGRKLEKTVEQQTASTSPKIPLSRQIQPVLPIEIIATGYGIEPAIIVQYLAAQIVSQANGKSTDFT